MNRVFLDLDGVVRNWDKGIYKWFNVEPMPDSDTQRGWDDISNYIQDKTGLSNSEFWERQVPDFWMSLDKTPEFDDIMKLMDRLADKPCILTSPSWDSATGTQHWIKTHMPDFFYDKRYLIGPAKSYCAGHGAYLIDDYEVNCSNFEAAGGRSILFPRPWNCMYNVTDGVVALEGQMVRLGLI